MEVTPVSADCWVSVEDLQSLETLVRRIEFPNGYKGISYWQRMWTPVVKKFFQIAVPNLLEQANIDRRALNPLAEKKFLVFKSEYSFVLYMFCSPSSRFPHSAYRHRRTLSGQCPFGGRSHASEFVVLGASISLGSTVFFSSREACARHCVWSYHARVIVRVARNEANASLESTGSR